MTSLAQSQSVAKPSFFFIYLLISVKKFAAVIDPAAD